MADTARSSGPPASLPYGALTKKHRDCDPKRFVRIEDLYAGGWTIQDKAKDYLPKHLLEHPDRHEARCNTASYQPFFGQILDQFVAELFTQPLTIAPAGDAKNPNTPGEFPDKEFYPALAKNIDGEGTELVALAADVLTTALKHRVAYVMVDAPDVEGEAANRAEEDAVGARRCYAYEVPASQVIDWKLDRKGVFQWVRMATRDDESDNPFAAENVIRETFTIWTVGADGKAIWARYAKAYTPEEKPTKDTLIELDDWGATSFDRIPLLRLELPAGLWVGNKIGPQALEHWRRRSELIGAESVSCVAIPFAKLGPEMPPVGEMNSEAQQDPDRGNDPVKQFERRGFLAMGHQDDLDFAEPEGKAYAIIDGQLKELRDDMYSVNHQMAASIRPSSTALGRSGLSKQKDQESTAKVLGALGRLVRGFFLGLYDTISKARGEKEVVWVAHGLDSYEHDDRQQVLEESIQVDLVAIPSPTFRKEHKKRVAAKLVPGLPPATVAQIANEIEAGVDSEEEMRQAANDAKLDQIKNPDQGGDGGEQQQQRQEQEAAE